MGNEIRCPQCGAIQECRKASAIYEQHSSNIDGDISLSGTGYSWSGEYAAGSANGKISATQQTFVAKKIAPPKKPPTGGDYVALLFLSFFLSWASYYFSSIYVSYSIINIAISTIIFFVGIVFLDNILGVTKRDDEKKKDWENKMAQWQRLWYCMRCGNKFYV